MTGGAAPHISEMEFTMPLYSTTPPDPVVTRFWSHVNFDGWRWADGSQCWLWIGAQTRSGGYGLTKHNGKHVPAHRVTYEMLKGPIPTGLQIDHLCRTPPCVNPAHLEPVTLAENVRRGISPSAANSRKTHCLRGHLFDKANTYVNRNGGRTCRTCRRNKQRPINRQKRAKEHA